MLKCGNVLAHVEPPSCETAVTSPRAPPSDQRSCCQTATKFAEFVGLTATHGSSSAFSYRTLPGASPTVHPANGLGPDTTAAGATWNTPASAPPAAANTASVTPPATTAFLLTPISSPLPLDDTG